MRPPLPGKLLSSPWHRQTKAMAEGRRHRLRSHSRTATARWRAEAAKLRRRPQGKRLMAPMVLLAMSLAASAYAQARDTPEQQPPIQARPGGPEGSPKTDQTVDVTKGTRLRADQQRRRGRRALVGPRSGAGRRPRTASARRSTCRPRT